MDVILDIQALQSVTHTCDCCADGQACCCAQFEVCVSAGEIPRIAAMMPAAAAYAPHILTEDGAPDNVFEETGDGLYAIDTHENGLCIFAFHRDGMTLCALHAAALDHGLPWHEGKPYVCTLWPATISEDDPPMVSVDPDAVTFHCTRARTAPKGAVAPALKDAIRRVFGAAAAARMS
ncbi:MAG: hypothetical protein ACLFTT_12575 [Candidatus Hydrogenedentota bacterium]